MKLWSNPSEQVPVNASYEDEKKALENMYNF